jgi:colanic acid biosynthesis protein WcaH
LAVVFKRLTLNELGVTVDINEVGYPGLYEHFYSESIFTDVDSGVTASAHYVVNCFEVILVDLNHELPEE